MKRLILLALLALLAAGCGRFGNETKAGSHAERIIVIGQEYNEIIWDLGAEKDVVGVDFSSTYPPAVKKTQTVGYHRALSAEGILSLRPTLIFSPEPNSEMRTTTSAMRSSATRALSSTRMSRALVSDSRSRATPIQ